MSCNKCNGTPVHSFRIIKREQIGHAVHVWFYTNEQEVVDRTPDSIVEHIRNELYTFHRLPMPKTWSWHYDARAFQLDMTAMDVFLRLLDVFVQYGSTLQHIYIVPNPMIQTMLQLIQPMLPEWMQNMIVMENAQKA